MNTAAFELYRMHFGVLPFIPQCCDTIIHFIDFGCLWPTEFEFLYPIKKNDYRCEIWFWKKNMLTYLYFIISKSYFKSGGAACLCYKDDPKFKNIPTDQILFPMPGEIGEVMSEPFGGMELS